MQEQMVVVGVGGCGRRDATGKGELRWEELVGEWVSQAGIQTPFLILTEDTGWVDLIKSYRGKTTRGKQYVENHLVVNLPAVVRPDDPIECLTESDFADSYIKSLQSAKGLQTSSTTVPATIPLEKCRHKFPHNP